MGLLIMTKFEERKKFRANAGAKLLTKDKGKENKLYTVFQDTEINGKPVFPEMNLEMREKFKNEQ